MLNPKLYSYYVLKKEFISKYRAQEHFILFYLGYSEEILLFQIFYKN